MKQMTTLKDMFAKAMSEREMRNSLEQNLQAQEWAKSVKPFILKELEKTRKDVNVLLENYVDTKNAELNDILTGHEICLFDEGMTSGHLYWPISYSVSTATLKAMRQTWKRVFPECFFEVFGVPCNIHESSLSNQVTVSVSVKYLY
jgi:hypothetical protein